MFFKSAIGSFIKMDCSHNHYYVVVIESRSVGKIAAMGTLFLEQKFIRGAAVAGHIEDIVVSKEFRGSGLGRMYSLYGFPRI
jgi:glucosamine-phosphate N-acetyltransferase